MTVQPTRDQLRALADDHRAMDHDTTADAIDGLLDQLAAAEQRIRDLTQEVRDERAACLDQMEQVQIRDARIKAARELHYHDVFRGHLDNGCAICGHDYPCPTVRALEG